jgi:glycosyltransferase involved in cell wall biosynthesis
MMKSDNPFFSIIIPTYNRSAFILNTLDSVFRQTFTSYEIIVVDNASTDNTLELLQPLIESGSIRLIVHDKNYERAKSRNTGQHAARGRFVTFLDSDDFMYRDNLQDAFDFANQHTTCRIFHNLYELVDEKWRPIYRFRFAPLANARRQICEGNFLSCIGVFLHQEIYQQIFWDETPELVGSEDYEFWIRVLAVHSNVGRINKINSGILHHEGRTMNAIQLETTRKRFELIIRKVRETPDLHMAYRDYLKKLSASCWLFLSSVSRKSETILTLKFLFKALRTDVNVLFSRNFYSHLLFLATKPFKQ